MFLQQNLGKNVLNQKKLLNDHFTNAIIQKVKKDLLSQQLQSLCKKEKENDKSETLQLIRIT